MMEQPEFLGVHRSQAQILINKSAIGEVVFSNGTYQVELKDEAYPEPLWTFLQFDPRDRLKDAFCSCEADSCVHLAAAYLFLFGPRQQLLQHRFEQSIWNAIGLCFVQQRGYQPKQLDGIDGEEILKRFFKQREQETEETSIKFSNLTEHEIEHWRAGRPSEELLYELSPWSDLAKWMFFQKEHASLSFPEGLSKLPTRLRVEFPQLQFELPLSEDDWRLIIPCLDSVRSGLEVHHMGGLSDTRVEYDRRHGGLHLHRKKQDGQTLAAQGTRVGKWLFVAGDGFYPAGATDQPANSYIAASAVPDFLAAYAERVEIEGVRVHHEAVSPKVQLRFDRSWNLHLDAYLDHPGDLQSGSSRLYRGWLFQDLGEGQLYPIKDLALPSLSEEVAREEVSDFVSEHRAWLNTQEGFHIHLAQVETNLHYLFEQDGSLRFESTVAEGAAVDFGRWVYVPAEGFYARKKGSIPSALVPGLTLSPAEIPAFLRRHRDELEQLPGFFIEQRPILDLSLSISLDEHDDIVVEPIYERADLAEGRDFRFHYPYIYVEDLGFYELSASERLPENYGQRRIIERPHIAQFLAEDLAKLEPFASRMDPRLQRPESLTLVVRECTRLDQGSYELDLRYLSDIGNTQMQDLIDAKEMQQRYCFSGAGLLDLDEERFSWLEHAETDNGRLVLSTLELLRLNAVETLTYLDESVEDQLHHLLNEFSAPEKPDLKGLASTLRPYQQAGTEWLYYLYHYGLSGLLCDDMGLGKTHQSMALIAAAVNRKKALKQRRKQRFLVVCPTSVIYHWEDKLAQFLPKVRVRTYYGPQRTLKLSGEPYDLILTSYGVLRRDQKIIGKLDFDLAIYDEIQIAKNHESRIHGALASIKARTRLGLTGTPIENRLRELKALFDLVLPGYMPGEAVYRESFVVPIEKEDDGSAKSLLSRVIGPFVLRRRKVDVLDDLPDKVEEIARCELHTEQRQLYNAVAAEGRGALMSQLQDGGAPVPYVHVFALLTHLKQICNHPAVYHKDVANYRQYSSGKWELFLELLEEARASKQKVVVFSQYLAMLDIIQSYLRESGIAYASIRGSTVDRGRELERFQNDPRCEVFVGSLQAAGVGIDLTAGSVVIHYDRWWNAARENQATDRVHRIGQHRGVQVFKMVCNQTLEEKVHMMIERKGELLEDIVAADDQGVLKRLDREDIMALLQGVGD